MAHVVAQLQDENTQSKHKMDSGFPLERMIIDRTFFPDGPWPVTSSYARRGDSASAHVLSCGCWSKRHASFCSFLPPVSHTCPCMISQRLHTATLTHACNTCAIAMHDMHVPWAPNTPYEDPPWYRSKGSSPEKKCLKPFGPQPFGIDFQRVQPNGFSSEKPTTKLQFPGQTN